MYLLINFCFSISFLKLSYTCILSLPSSLKGKEVICNTHNQGTTITKVYLKCHSIRQKPIHNRIQIMNQVYYGLVLNKSHSLREFTSIFYIWVEHSINFQFHSHKPNFNIAISNLLHTYIHIN